MSVTEFASIILAAALINNLVLVQLLGVSSLFAYSRTLNSAIELSLLIFVVMVATTMVSVPLIRLVLAPLGLEFLQLIVVVAVSSSCTAVLLRLIGRHYPLSMRRHGWAFLLVGGNSAIVGLALQNSLTAATYMELVVGSIGAGLGMALLLVAFAAMRQRLDASAAPAAFRGPALYLISAGFVAMSLLGFAGAG